MKEAVETYWQGNETVKAQLEKHLDRIYYQLFAKDQTCPQTRGEEQSPIDGSRADTLHATTSLDTSCIMSGKASFSVSSRAGGAKREAAELSRALAKYSARQYSRNAPSVIAERLAISEPWPLVLQVGTREHEGRRLVRKVEILTDLIERHYRGSSPESLSTTYAEISAPGATAGIA
ncbi:hypothetical protein QFC20_004191 [Naganishia adeliensis]|uniref:Uncharacterized protein n=1 Tax=Naganishia adeliensis TaxID=92952 RepID=A0ACC2W458_9TREE|nr:hypothetical protein QFC20_004191 [Naganishia adeliensis]